VDFPEVSPSIARSAFVGDGLTGTGSGAVQVFHAPETATRFYLGFFDAASCASASGLYGDNSGSIPLTVEVSCEAAP
jgi:hypothetical protein